MAVGAVAFPLTEIAPAYKPTEQIPVAAWTPPPDAVPMPLREPFNPEGRACGVLWVVPPEWDGSGMPITVDVYWEARCAFDMYWSAFIHFSDLTRETCTAGDTGHILAQHDSMPDGGNTPLPALKAGYVLPDALTVTPPDGLDLTRDWHVQIGLYDAAGGSFIRAFILDDVDDRESEVAGTDRVSVGRCAPETVVITLPARE
jgi:hypothetical protein